MGANETTATDNLKNMGTDASQLQPDSQFCFRPFPQKSGTSQATLAVGIYDNEEETYVSDVEDIVIHAVVLNTNDRPVVSKSTFKLPEPLPYELADVTGDGFTVSNILASGGITDADGDSIGSYLNVIDTTLMQFLFFTDYFADSRCYSMFL